jgi:predicted hotdog family 3-hydroxylacyl-ACP dehydratase
VVADIVDISTLVPHSGRMLLLDTFVRTDEQSLVAQYTFRDDTPFVRDGAAGAWVALELMAQAIAAYAGYQGRMRGEPPKIGFLIGSRHFSCTHAAFAVGTTVTISVECQLQDESGLGSFLGTVTSGDVTATATLAVFQPNNVEEFLLKAGS